MSFTESAIYQTLTNLDQDSPRRLREILDGIDDKEINNLGANGESYLHVLAQNVRPDTDMVVAVPLAFQLANNNIDVNVQDKNGNTALHVAVLNNSPAQLINTLFKIGIDPTIKNANNKLPITLTTDQQTKSVLALLHPGLWLSALNGDARKVRVLLDSWCSTDVFHDGTYIDDQLKNEQPTIMQMIEEVRPTNRFVHAVLAGDEQLAASIMQKSRDKINLNTADVSNFNNSNIWPLPLTAAVASLGMSALVNYLVQWGVDVNEPVETRDDAKLPLYYYVLTECARAAPLELLPTLAKADLAKLPFDSADLLITAAAQRWPLAIVNTLFGDGRLLANRDIDGFSVRDRVLLKSLNLGKADLKQNMRYVDSVVEKLMEDDEVDIVKQLVLGGYKHVYDISVRKQRLEALSHAVCAGRSTPPGSDAKRARKTDINQNSCDQIDEHRKQEFDQFDNKLPKSAIGRQMRLFLNDLPQYLKSIEQLFMFGKRGNLAALKHLLNVSQHLSAARDGALRNVLHVAVIYDRRFVAKFLVNSFAHMASEQDIMGRTPAHYAMMHPESEDWLQCFTEVDSCLSIADRYGMLPSHYVGQSECSRLLHKARSKQYGLDVYLLEKYMQLIDAIKANNYNELKVIRLLLWPVSFGHLIEKMLHFNNVPLKDLVWMCIEYDRERFAVSLVKDGMSFHNKGICNGTKMTVVEAAQYKNMFSLIQEIEYCLLNSKERRSTSSNDSCDSTECEIDSGDDVTLPAGLGGWSPISGTAVHSVAAKIQPDASTAAEATVNPAGSHQNPNSVPLQSNSLLSPKTDKCCSLM